jgi:23S rRNA (uracil1939-C5)-methyltransferase
LAAFGSELTGQGPARIQVTNWNFDLHPLAFFQSNRYLLTGFLKSVLNHTAGAKRVLDLFCGSGFFTIPLAREVNQVLGVESSRIAVRQARINTGLNNVANAEFFEGSVEETLKASPDVRPDLIVMNPPRSGAGKNVAARLTELKASRLIYVSCNPATFGREAAVLLERGYKLKTLTLVDQFPNTYHIETVALFEV